MKAMLRNKHFYYMMAADACLIALAYLMAYELRFDGHIDSQQWGNFKSTLPYILPLKLSCLFFFGLYRGMWRYTSLVDLRNVIKASFFSSIVVILGILFAYHFQGFSRSVFILDWVLTILLISGARVVIRQALTHSLSVFWFFNKKDPLSRKLIVIGAGDAGEKVLREIIDNPGIHLEPIGFLDDSPEKQGKSIHGVPVLGTIADIDQIKDEFDEILIAVPSAKGRQMRRIVSVCEKTGKKFLTIPGMGEIIDGRVSVRAIREVKLEDLMGRKEVRLDHEGIRRFLFHKRVLVTGAGGSIGSELVRQICRYQPEQLALMDFSEFNLFQTERDCRQQFPYIPVKACLTDIRDRGAVLQTLREFQPQVIFHAAAYKHVPLQELHPRETVHNNILGTRNLVEAALVAKVENFVLVSTDKAVRPTNVMGACKRVAEMLLEARSRNGGTRFMAVRFGNVLGSSGSVIPIFQQQIARGNPVTVTHPEVRRYFMSTHEAAQLILQAGAMGEGGEIFILDMGDPVQIVEMARDLIRLNGLEPEKDIPIQFIGLRPGEKLYEELITEGEGIVATSHEKIRVIRGNHYDLDTLNTVIDELIALSDTYDETAIKLKLKEIVPEYIPRKVD